jgi:Replication-relaxation
VAPSRALEPDQLDLEILALTATLRHVLTSQIHRRFNADRAITTTQRRLKRLSDAGLVERFQFHRRDGGGVPMCYVITPAGLAMVRTAHGHAVEGEGDDLSLPDLKTHGSLAAGERRLREARRDVHVAGWVLSLERVTSPARCTLCGPEESVLSPPMRSTADGRTQLGPGDLRLPGGRTPHDFLRTDASGEAVEVEHFDTVRPNAIVELSREGRQQTAREDTGAPSPNAIDVFVEFDDRLPSGRAAAKLERYDHFLSGWAAHTNRYGRRLQAVAVVVFVCRDRPRARECARRADAGLRACRAYAGEYPFDWDYPARERILFASERDMHEGLSSVYGVPRLPPEVRASAGHGDPSAREAVAEAKDIIGVAMASEWRPDEPAPSDG